ncbi:MAG: BMP family ABC transporter substrate-binding protein, partial [Oscillospiraceae bacterium]|nr:BMP family ABC transporter substrate-binding protein [Oscillospiraceae bacterium]
MKKIIALLLALVMVLGLAACGETAAPETTPAATEGTEGTAEATEGTEAAGGLADLTVGAIYINSKNDTAGYTFAHHNGIVTAMKELGMDPETQLVIQDEIPEDKEQVLTAIDTLVGEGANIIFGISFGYIDAMAEAAEEYPEVIFSHGTGYLSNETNFNNYFGRAYQARYLAGIAAGLKSLELKNNNIGYVAAYGTEYAETASGINGFAMGVLAVNPEATIHVKTLGAWADEVNESAFAKELIESYNCGVITQHCDSA